MPTTVVEGPAWCTPGLDYRNGRYPLAVEGPVLNMVDKLVPGVSTLTQIARYYSLYWALADFSTERGLDVKACQTLLRRSEVALAWASLINQENDPLGKAPLLHGADRVRTRSRTDPTRMADLGHESYSPRNWGFWSQYGGPSAVLGTAAVESGALRAGSRQCPQSIRRMFWPLFEVAEIRPVTLDDVAGLTALADISAGSADVAAVREVLLAASDEEEHSGNDLTRRSVFRLLARSVQIRQRPEDGWVAMFEDAIAYGSAIGSDPVLAQEERAQAWRGTLLRHHSVGAWRRLWSGLVGHALGNCEPTTREGIHGWLRTCVSESTVREFMASCPDTVDAHGHPYPAEREVSECLSQTEADLAILALGARRNEQLTGLALHGFRGGRPARRQFLDPTWVQYRYQEHLDLPLADFLCTLADDMLAQSRRVALRKLRFDADGRITLFSKLHERDGRYFAIAPEGAGNIGLRVRELGELAVQLGVLEMHDTGATVTGLGCELLELGK